jgi:hypothetical protein
MLILNHALKMFSNSNGMLKNLDKKPLKSYMENQELLFQKTYF